MKTSGSDGKKHKAYSRERLDEDTAAPVQWEALRGEEQTSGTGDCVRRPGHPMLSGWDEVDEEKGRKVEGREREHGLGRARETILLTQQNNGENSG